MDELRLSAELMREKLGSISSVKKEKLTDEEAKARDGDVETFYRNIFKEQIDKFIQEQLEFIGKKAVSDSQLQFGRGTINGFLLMKEWMEDKTAASLARFDKKGEENIVN